jgi:hypothetical protein
MNDVIKVKVISTPQTNTGAVMIIVFLIIIILLAAAFYAIITFLPNSNNQPLYGSCADQTNCKSGLVCGRSPTFTGTVCLSGLGQVCETSSECSAGLSCTSATGGFFCLLPPLVDKSMIDLSINNTMQDLRFTGFPSVSLNLSPLNETQKRIILQQLK